MYEIRRMRCASASNSPQNQASRIDDKSVRIVAKFRETQPARGFGFGANSWVGGAGSSLRGASPGMYESRRKRGASGPHGPRIRRPGSTANRLGLHEISRNPVDRRIRFPNAFPAKG